MFLCSCWSGLVLLSTETSKKGNEGNRYSAWRFRLGRTNNGRQEQPHGCQSQHLAGYFHFSCSQRLNGSQNRKSRLASAHKMGKVLTVRPLEWFPCGLRSGIYIHKHLPPARYSMPVPSNPSVHHRSQLHPILSLACRLKSRECGCCPPSP